jgi:methyl-accepting chemotaxis protein
MAPSSQNQSIDEEVMLLSTLRARLVAVCVATVLTGMLSVVGANYVTTRSQLLERLEVQTRQLADSHAATIAAWIQSKKLVVSSIVQSAGEEDAVPALKAARQAGGFDDAYIGYQDKRASFSQSRSRAPDYDPTKRPWFIKASEASTPVVTSPYVSASTGKLLVTFAEAVRSQSKVIAVASADVLLDTVVQIVVGIKATPNSFAFLVDSAGKIIAHPDSALALKPVSDIDPGLNSGFLSELERSQRSKYMELDGNAVMLQAVRVPGTDWKLLIALDRDDAMQPLKEMLTSSVLIAALIACAASALLGALIAKALVRLGLVRDALNDIASGEGDLTQRIDASGTDELAQIARAFNQFIQKMSILLREIRASSEIIKIASSEIAHGNADLSARTESQAGALEETASAMEELTSGVQQNSDNAHQANTLAAGASRVAAQGGEMVSRMVDTMIGIDASSKRVVDIIAVIDGIAFQTNILALNAAVEAARAGEQGRGFAVVASEVRVLAQRSALAAKEIAGLIGDSTRQVSEGSLLAMRAGTTIQEVVASVQRVSSVMAEISAASAEQDRGVGEINSAILQMDEVTQRNAALVEEVAAAAHSLQEQALKLSQVVNLFTLD